MIPFFFFLSHIWQFHLTLCNSNITFDSFFVIFNGSLILFFLHLTISSSHFIIPTSHIVVFLSHLVIFLFLFLRLTVPSSHCITLTPYLTVFLSNLVVFFFSYIWRIHTNEDDFIPYKPIRLVFIVPVCTLVQKRGCFVPVKILAMPNPFRPYREMYRVSTRN